MLGLKRELHTQDDQKVHRLQREKDHDRLSDRLRFRKQGHNDNDGAIELWCGRAEEFQNNAKGESATDTVNADNS